MCQDLWGCVWIMIVHVRLAGFASGIWRGDSIFDYKILCVLFWLLFQFVRVFGDLILLCNDIRFIGVIHLVSFVGSVCTSWLVVCGLIDFGKDSCWLFLIFSWFCASGKPRLFTLAILYFHGAYVIIKFQTPLKSFCTYFSFSSFISLFSFNFLLWPIRSLTTGNNDFAS